VRRVVALSGTVVVLLCMLLVLLAAPVGADDSETRPPAADDQYKGPVDDQYDKVDEPDGPPGDVDNPRDVVPGTDVGKKVPVTGGPPIIILAAAGALLSGALIAGSGIILRR
jgi:hypothetical protein